MNEEKENSMDKKGRLTGMEPEFDRMAKISAKQYAAALQNMQDKKGFRDWYGRVWVKKTTNAGKVYWYTPEDEIAIVETRAGVAMGMIFRMVAPFDADPDMVYCRDTVNQLRRLKKTGGETLIVTDNGFIHKKWQWHDEAQAWQTPCGAEVVVDLEEVAIMGASSW